VLSDADKRKIYDQFGEEGLKQSAGMGGSAGPGGGFGGFHDPMDIFKQFFGAGGFGGEEFDGFGMGGMHGMGGMPGFNFRSNGFPGGGSGGFTGGNFGPRKDPPIKREFEMSLEDLYRGKVKKFNVTKTITDEHGNSRQESKVLEIDVKPGWRDGTKITFHNEGDVRPGVEPADMIFVVKEKPHPYFTREKEHLIYKVPITLSQALRGVKLQIPHLDGSTKEVSITDRVIEPFYVHRLEGAGMPKPKEPGLYGDMLLKFNIAFPVSLTKDQKELVKQALQGVDYRS